MGGQVSVALSPQLWLFVTAALGKTLPRPVPQFPQLTKGEGCLLHRVVW
jgi:hypothetical protein